MREDLPEGLSLEGPGLGVLDARSTVEDGLSDRDDSSDDDEVVEISELERFASALQEAQRRAVRLEIEKAKWKRKTPKTYLGNSKATIARREKNHQALVSRGFHDVFTFLALKERGRLASGRSLEGGEPADRPLAGGVGETVPDRVQRVDQGVDASLNVGAWGAVDVSRRSSPGHVECDWNGGDRSRSRDANATASTTIGVLRHSLPGRVDDSQRLDDQVDAWAALDVSRCSSPGRVERGWGGGNRSHSRDANATASTAIGVLRHSSPGRVDDGWRLDDQVGAWDALDVSHRSLPGHVERDWNGSD